MACLMRRYGRPEGVSSTKRWITLNDLRINTIYFNPLFYSHSLHKYDGIPTITSVIPFFGPDEI